MAGAADHKRFIDRVANSKFAHQFDTWINAGKIPPFSILFPETALAHLADRDKPGKDIIQFSFLLRDNTGNVLTTIRKKFGAKTPYGHSVTTGDSVLVSWSPVVLPPGRRWPATERDIRFAFHKEVPEIPGLSPAVSFLGFAMNQVEKLVDGVPRTWNYHFYLFEARYPATPDFSQLTFHKDRNDEPVAFVPIDDTLRSALHDKRADLCALEAVSPSGLPQDPRCSFVPLRAGFPPPFLDNPQAVFISHATADDEVVKELANRLRSEGVSCWVDHDALEPGNRWRWEISQTIEYGPCFIVVCSKTSRSSAAVKDEIAQALSRCSRDEGYLLLPIVLDGDDIGKSLHDGLGEFQAIDFREYPSDHSCAQKLVELVKDVAQECGYL